MKYRVVKTVKCNHPFCAGSASVGFRYGLPTFSDINEAHRQLNSVLINVRYTCDCRAELVEVKD